MTRFLFIIPLIFLMSCKKNEFQSCSNYEKLVGEWEGINSDTKYTISFDKRGKVIHRFGLERKIKYIATECAYEKDQKSDYYYYYFIRSDWGLTNYKINPTFDSIITNVGAQDISEDTTMLYKMKFVKVK